MRRHSVASGLFGRPSMQQVIKLNTSLASRPHTTLTRLRTCVALAATAAVLCVLVAPAAGAEPILVGGSGSNCMFYYGPFGVGQGKENVAFPEAGANYWAAIYSRPAGSTLRLRGIYPHSRYMSFITYRPVGTPLDGIADYQIAPDPGSTNPFIAGARRDLAKRSFTLNVLAQTNPGFPLMPDTGQRRRNDIYAEDVTSTAVDVPPGTLEGIVIRVYTPDRGRSITGGVSLPMPELTLSDGTKLTGQAACDALDAQAKKAGTPRAPDPAGLHLDVPTYRALRYPNLLTAPCNVLTRNQGCPTDYSLPDALVQVPRPVPSYFPAQSPPVLRAAYDRRYQLQMYTGDNAPGANPHPVRDLINNPTRGFFGNIHNAYLEGALSRKLGKVVVVRGRAPTTPKTRAGERRMGSGQMRFWSVCMTQALVTGATTGCLFDEQVPTDRRGNYTIVISRKADRPKTADAAHGIAWLQWSATGDGDLDHDFGRIVIRNMLPQPSFKQAIQRTRTAGDERAVMGPYMPTLSYVKNAAAFDRANKSKGR